MELKTLEFSKNGSYFYQTTKTNPPTQIIKIKSKNPNNKFEIHLSYANSSLKNQGLESTAERLCDLIQSEVVHQICIVNSDKNQYSVLLGIMPSFESFNNVYKPKTKLQKSVFEKNFKDYKDRDYCDTVFFYTMTQLQAQGYSIPNTKTLTTSFIGLNFDGGYTPLQLHKEFFQLLLHSLGQIPSFRYDKFSYLSLASLCTYKSQGNRSNSAEYGSYLSVDHGETNLFENNIFFKDDNSLELEHQDLENDFQTLEFLDVLGYETSELTYPQKKYIFFQGVELKDFVGNNFGEFTKKNNSKETIFEIFPNLPAGLIFDSKTGQITGNPIQSFPNTVYLIKCNQKWKTSIELEVKNQQQDAPSISNAVFTSLTVFLVLVLLLAIVAAGYKVFH